MKHGEGPTLASVFSIDRARSRHVMCRCARCMCQVVPLRELRVSRCARASRLRSLVQSLVAKNMCLFSQEWSDTPRPYCTNWDHTDQHQPAPPTKE